MASIESGRGDNALAQLAEATKKFSVFLSPELDGTTFLQTLAQTSADIRVHSQRLNEQGVPDFAAVSRAEVSFRSCEDAFRTFASDAKAWLGFKIGQEAPDRMALATKVVDGLRRQLGEVAQAARKAHDGAWAAIDLEAAVTAPDAVFEHVATFRCADHMASAASRLVERLRADAVANGALALEPLRKFTRLAELDRAAGRQGVHAAARPRDRPAPVRARAALVRRGHQQRRDELGARAVAPADASQQRLALRAPDPVALGARWRELPDPRRPHVAVQAVDAQGADLLAPVELDPLAPGLHLDRLRRIRPPAVRTRRGAVRVQGPPAARRRVVPGVGRPPVARRQRARRALPRSPQRG